MIKNLEFRSSYNNYCFITLLVIYLVIPNICLAGIITPGGTTPNILGTKDLHAILSNIRTIFPAVTSLILAISFLCGIGFMFRGVLMLRNFGQSQSMNRNNEMFAPFLYMFVGSALIYLPSTTKSFSDTIFGMYSNNIFASTNTDEVQMIVLKHKGIGGASTGSNNDLFIQNNVKFQENGGQTLLGYLNSGGAGTEWMDLMNTVVIFIQFVGFVAFIRGWFIISHSTGSGAQQGAFSKGLIHLIGGVIAINFIPFINSIEKLVS